VKLLYCFNSVSKFSNILYDECFLKRNRLLSSLDSKNQIQSFLFFLLISWYLFSYLKKLIYYCRCTTWFKNLRRKEFHLTMYQPKREIEQPRKTSLVESNWLHCTILQINLLLHNTSCILFLVDCIVNCKPDIFLHVTLFGMHGKLWYVRFSISLPCYYVSS
jgi:hypothetical protein